jgi:hypothetical protein
VAVSQLQEKLNKTHAHAATERIHHDCFFFTFIITFYVYCRVDKSVDTKVSEEHITSIFRTKDGGSMCHLNLGIHTEFHTDSFRC